MYPIIFQYNGLVISSYGLMLMLAFLTCNILLKKYLISISKDERIADDIIFYAAIGGILGSKLYYVIEESKYYEFYLSVSNIFKGLVTFNFEVLTQGISQFGGGLVFLGGLIGGMISVSIYLYKNNIKWLEGADWVAPYLILGHAIGRIGCFLVGDCYGTISNMPWAMTFENGLPPSTYFNFSFYYPDVFNSELFKSIYPQGTSGETLIYVHPTQLYESLAGLVIFLYLNKIRNNRKYYGMVMFEYLFLAGLARFLVEFLRLNQSYLFDLSGAQLISIFMMITGVIFMKINNSKTNLHGNN